MGGRSLACRQSTGRDTLAVLPTGAGKSAIYQAAALAIPGPTVVVEPLTAFQRDRVESIEEAELAPGRGRASMSASARTEGPARVAS